MKITLFALLITSGICCGEHLLVSTVAPNGAWTISIVGAYQVEDEIWITSKTEKSYPAGADWITYPYDKVEVDLPTILAKQVGDEEFLGGWPLWIHREQVEWFNYDWGDGWVNSEACGLIYMRHYPWVWHWYLDWVLVQEGEIVSDIYPEIELEYSKEKKLSYYLYSPSKGWLWKSPKIPEYYSYEKKSYLSVTELIEG